MIPLLVFYHYIATTFTISPLKCDRYLNNCPVLAFATGDINEDIFNIGQFFSPIFGFVLSKLISWSQTDCLVILNITSFSPCSSGMFEDSTYLYLIEPMDLTHTAVSLFLSNLWESAQGIPNKRSQ